MPPRKTYAHLQVRGRMPNEYEIVSTDLAYHVRRGLEVAAPLAAWYERYQRGSPLVCSDWERFRDPRETTYPRYTSLARCRELFVDGLLEFVQETGYDERLDETWVRTLARVFAPLRFPVHGLQMIAAYVGQMAPSGRITMTALFQAADEMRRVQRVAYRVRQLQRSRPGLFMDGKALWERDPIWQPLREAVERLLVTYDWGEAFVALDRVLKPMLDDLFMRRFGDLAQRRGDYVMGELCFSLAEDCRWHEEWSRALVALAVEDAPANRDVISRWVHKWHPLAARAVRAFDPVFEEHAEIRTAEELIAA